MMCLLCRDTSFVNGFCFFNRVSLTMYRPLVSQTLGENVKKNFFPVINISALGEKNFREKFINNWWPE